MKRIAYLAVFILTLAFLAACQQEEVPTPSTDTTAEIEQPTDIPPTEEPVTEAPTEEPAEMAEEPAQEPVEEPAEEAAAEAPAAPAHPPYIGQQTERLRALDFSPFEEALANFSEERAAVATEGGPPAERRASRP